jgi:hypothetical protein
MDFTINAQFDTGRFEVWASSDYLEIAVEIKKALTAKFAGRNYSDMGKIVGFIISQKVS